MATSCRNRLNKDERHKYFFWCLVKTSHTDRMLDYFYLNASWLFHRIVHYRWCYTLSTDTAGDIAAYASLKPIGA
jgi:hypothetical protein